MKNKNFEALEARPRIQVGEGLTP